MCVIRTGWVVGRLVRLEWPIYLRTDACCRRHTAMINVINVHHMRTALLEHRDLPILTTVTVKTTGRSPLTLIVTRKKNEVQNGHCCVGKQIDVAPSEMPQS